MDTQIEPVMEPDPKRFIPAILANKFAPAHPDEAARAVRRALEGCPFPVSSSAVMFFANGLRKFELDAITETYEGLAGARNAHERLAHSLANFIQFQTIAFPPGRSTFIQESACPSDVDAIYRWAASELHAYGRLQSIKLASAVNTVVRWCHSSGLKKLDIIESPLGATLPVRVMEKVLSDNGIEATSYQFLAPRLDKHGKKYSIERAAKDFCKTLPPGSHPVLFPDEVLTGTRFLKLYRALNKQLRNRLVPIAFRTSDATNPNPPRPEVIERLEKRLRQSRTCFQGLPTLFNLPPALLFYVDKGNPFCASNPFFWTELDVCAGKRKVNLIFGLLSTVRGILEKLGDPNGEMIGRLCEMWTNERDGTTVTEHESILRLSVPRLAKMINWDVVEAAARETFLAEYRGNDPQLNAERVDERMEWVLDQIREQIDGRDKDGATEGWLLRHAASDLFALSHGSGAWKMPRDRDFCEYTLPFTAPISSIHEELVRRVLADVSPQSVDLCRLCGFNPTDEDSHILPKFVGRKAKKCGKNRLISLTGSDQFVQDTTKLPFLCTVCEDAFGRDLETPFANKWFHRYPNFATDQNPDDRTVRFYNSVAWRVLRYQIEKGYIPEQLAKDAQATESSLRHHLQSGGPAPPLNAYLFYASDFNGIQGAVPQELLEAAAGFSVVVFNVTPLRSAVVSLIGPFVHVLEMQAHGKISGAMTAEWEDFRLITGMPRAPSHQPPLKVTRYLKRILCTQRGQYTDDVMPSP